MRESHVVKDHHKVMLRGSQQIRSENDSQNLGSHLIVGDPTSSKREGTSLIQNEQ